MANVKLIFQGSENSKTDENELQLFHNTNNEIFISIKDENGYEAFICLDKKTAIKLHRELKKQISFFTEEGGYNG